MRRIGLVSCVKKKASAPCQARDLYISPYFRKMRRFVEASCDDWRILSALHHMIRPTQVIPPYEKTMKGMPRSEQRSWARTVYSQIRDEFQEPDAIILEIHGGREYIRDLVPFLTSAGYRVELPVPPLPIGKRMQWYDRNAPGERQRPPRSSRSKETARSFNSVTNLAESDSRCAKVHELLETLPEFDSVDARVPSDGLYFFYEKGELNGHDGSSPRIVRVGNHPRRLGGLPNRLRTHYSGSKNSSVFRKFLGGALLRRSDPNHPCLEPSPGQGHWEKQDERPCQRCKPTEQSVSELLRETFRFRCVEIADREERNRFEEGLLATLAACQECMPSPKWLGKNAYNEHVRDSGLWNANYVLGSTPLNPRELSRFEELVSTTNAARL